MAETRKILSVKSDRDVRKGKLLLPAGGFANSLVTVEIGVSNFQECLVFKMFFNVLKC